MGARPASLLVAASIAAASLLACSSAPATQRAGGETRSEHAGDGQDETTTAPDQTTTDAPSVPRCGAPIAAIAQLTDFTALTPAAPALHYVDVRRDATTGEWAPVAHIDMPLHHATHLTWANLDHFSPLANASGETLRFTLRALSRDIQHRADENVFFVDYVARVEMVCSVDAPVTRAEGVLLANVELDTSACERLTADVIDAARALATCSRNADCVVIDFGACDIPGLGCYFVPANRSHSDVDLRAAVQRLEQEPCRMADCDCPMPPTTAHCERGACVAP